MFSRRLAVRRGQMMLGRFQSTAAETPNHVSGAPQERNSFGNQPAAVILAGICTALIGYTVFCRDTKFPAMKGQEHPAAEDARTRKPKYGRSTGLGDYINEPSTSAQPAQPNAKGFDVRDRR
jgi:hypothetical protein